jgi:hypothetical protein
VLQQLLGLQLLSATIILQALRHQLLLLLLLALLTFLMLRLLPCACRCQWAHRGAWQCTQAVITVGN